MSCRATSVVLLLGLALAVAEGDLYEGYSLGSSCLPGHPCILAFISENPMILHCPRVYFRDHVSWQYLDPAWVQEQPATFQCSRGSFSPVLIHAKLQRLHFKSQLLAGNLYILSPSVEDSGLYTCSAGDATIAYYHVDFQDAGYIHVSHAKLGEATLDNTTVKLASGDVATLFTSWSPWQACDRCSQPGERKQVGYCYVQVTGKDHQLKKPLPCGMARRKHPTLPWRGPELRVETCQVPCAASFLLGQDKPNVELPLVFATYHPQLKAHLHCPASSIYRYRAQATSCSLPGNGEGNEVSVERRTGFWCIQQLHRAGECLQIYPCTSSMDRTESSKSSIRDWSSRGPRQPQAPVEGALPGLGARWPAIFLLLAIPVSSFLPLSGAVRRDRRAHPLPSGEVILTGPRERRRQITLAREEEVAVEAGSIGQGKA
uniref:Ig-like domain-containing protein n=1 Tax=Varanus komodoensis TaxID=61221 RepID=A0A8D2IVS6_VARKO